jgi:hypothetical protein
MTSHTGRLYALAGALFVFFVLWAAIAAHPWSTAKAAPDPRILALQAREHRIRVESVRVKRILDRRFAAYHVALARRERQIAHARALIRLRARQAAAQKAAYAKAVAARTAALAATPAPTYSAPASYSAPAPSYSAPAPTYSAPRIVNLPPVVITRTS